MQELDFNIENFVEHELKIGPLKRNGWTTETLLKLFVSSSGFKQPGSYPYKICPFCKRFEPFVPESWIIYSEAVKNNQDGAVYRVLNEKFHHSVDGSDDGEKLKDGGNLHDNEDLLDFESSNDNHKISDGTDKNSEIWHCQKCLLREKWRPPIRLPEDNENDDVQSLTMHIPGSLESYTSYES